MAESLASFIWLYWLILARGAEPLGQVGQRGQMLSEKAAKPLPGPRHHSGGLKTRPLHRISYA